MTRVSKPIIIAAACAFVGIAGIEQAQALVGGGVPTGPGTPPISINAGGGGSSSGGSSSGGTTSGPTVGYVSCLGEMAYQQLLPPMPGFPNGEQGAKLIIAQPGTTAPLKGYTLGCYVDCGSASAFLPGPDYTYAMSCMGPSGVVTETGMSCEGGVAQCAANNVNFGGGEPTLPNALSTGGFGLGGSGGM
jgi:hypothetical protein